MSEIPIQETHVASVPAKSTPAGPDPAWEDLRGRVLAALDEDPVNTAFLARHLDHRDASFTDALGAMADDGLVVDGIIAKSDSERDGIWAIRGEVEWLVRDAQNFDVSLRSADIGQYVDDVTARISADFPAAVVAAFGHLGDNNIHISVVAESADANAAGAVERHIYESLLPYEGAISAEHGIGLEKRRWLSISRTENEIELMRSLKQMMDPENILNPGKVLGADSVGK